MRASSPQRRRRPPRRECRECARPVYSWTDGKLCPLCLRDVLTDGLAPTSSRPAPARAATVLGGQLTFEQALAGDTGAEHGPAPFDPYDIPF